MQELLDLSIELNASFATFILKTMPLAVMIVTDDVRVWGINDAAMNFFGISKEVAPLEKGGDVLKCINAYGPGGCGGSARCVRCVLRNSVLEALSGQVVSRNKGILEVIHDGEVNRLTLLVTAAPIKYERSRMVIMLIEDVSLVTQLEGLIPICSLCHSIRDDQGEWIMLEKYLITHSEAELTHDYCPICSDKIRANYALDKEQRS